MDGLLFGFVDNFVLLLGLYFGIEVERYLGGNTARGAVIGGCIGNTVSDGIGALADPSMSGMFFGIVIGCLLPMALIPILERFQTTTGANE